jgi:hypothetical protein
MKKLLTAAAFAALAFGMSGTVATAAPNFSQVCTDNGDFGLSHGECTSILNGFFNKGKGANDAAAFCRDIRAEDPAFFDANFKNLGACMKVLKPAFPG